MGTPGSTHSVLQMSTLSCIVLLQGSATGPPPPRSPQGTVRASPHSGCPCCFPEGLHLLCLLSTCRAGCVWLGLWGMGGGCPALGIPSGEVRLQCSEACFLPGQAGRASLIRNLLLFQWGPLGDLTVLRIEPERLPRVPALCSAPWTAPFLACLSDCSLFGGTCLLGRGCRAPCYRWGWQ